MFGWLGGGETDATSGSLPRLFAVIGFPLLAQNATRVLQSLADLYWVGRLNASAVAAIGLAFAVFGILLAGFAGSLFLATQILVSRRFGNDDRAGVRNVTFSGLTLSLGGGLVIGLVLYANAELLVAFMARVQPDAVGTNVVSLAVEFLQILALGLPLATASDVIEAALIGCGDSRGTFTINATAVAADVVLNPILIFGWGPVPALGIRGAALATVAGYVAGLALALAFVANGRAGGVVSLSAVGLRTGDYRSLFEVGAPVVGRHVTVAARELVEMLLVFAIGGTAAVTAYFIGNRVSHLAYVLPDSVQRAAQNILGQNLGADRPGRAKRTVRVGLVVCVVTLTVVAAGQWLSAAAIPPVFVPGIAGEDAVLATAYLRVLAYSYPAAATLRMFKSAFHGAKRTQLDFYFTLLRHWVIRLPALVVALVVFDVGVYVAFWIIAASEIVGAVVVGAYYFSTADEMFAAATVPLDGAGD